ncbi:MAG: hypothetical protein H6733_04620 [Alphaproteobacteria bacterium]|nr:hypothetical protein [Alphaproteobacteria bacterium]
MSEIWDDELDAFAHLSVDRRAQAGQDAARHTRVRLVDEESHSELDVDDLLNLLDAAGDLVLEAPRPRSSTTELPVEETVVTVHSPDDATAIVQPPRPDREAVWEADEAPTSVLDPRRGEPEPSAFREALRERRARHRHAAERGTAVALGGFDDLDEEPTALLDLGRIPTYAGPLTDVGVDTVDDDESTQVDPGLAADWAQDAEVALHSIARDHAVHEALMSDSAAALHEVRALPEDDLSPDPTWNDGPEVVDVDDEDVAPAVSASQRATDKAWAVDEMPTWPEEVTRPWRAQTTGNFPAMKAAPAEVDVDTVDDADASDDDVLAGMEDPDSLYESGTVPALHGHDPVTTSWDNEFGMEDTQSFARFRDTMPATDDAYEEEEERPSRPAARVIPGHALSGSYRRNNAQQDVSMIDVEATGPIPTWDVRAAAAAEAETPAPKRQAARVTGGTMPSAATTSGSSRIGSWKVEDRAEAEATEVSPLMAGLYGLGLSLIVGGLLLGVWMALR